MEAFKELREFITAEEKAQFIQSNSTTPAFYAKLLAAELRFAEILDLAKAQQNAWDFNDLVKPIINIYPIDIFELQTKRTIEQLTLHASTRTDYKRICKNLQTIKEIKGMEEQKNEFIKRLKKQFKNHPEFIEELAQAGF